MPSLQQKRILQYLREHEWLENRPEVMLELHCQKFSSRLGELRKQGYEFLRGKTDIGTAKYKLLQEPNPLILPQKSDTLEEHIQAVLA